MDAQTLLDNLGAIANAPGGVDRLRELILDLAVGGKLVSQDLEDEPAADLLKRIQSEKAAMSSRTGVRQGKRPAPLDEQGLDLPRGWEWTQLDALGFVAPRNDADDSTVAGFVPMNLVPTELREPHSFEERPWGEIRKAYTHIADGDIAVAKITPCFENGKSTVFESLPAGVGAATTELHVLRPTPDGVVPRYVLLYLKSPQFRRNGEPRMTGTAGQKRLPRDYFAGAPFPLPPRPEQERIVAKVDELMQLCDDLEARQRSRYEVETRARASAIHVLTAAGSDGDLHAAWARIEQNWGALVGDAEGVDAVRTAVLQLAVEGRLTSPESSDGSAGQLLEEIQAGLASEDPVDPSRIPYELPSTWRWVHLENVCANIVDCLHKTPRYVEHGYPAIRTSDVEPGRILLDRAKQVDEATFKERTSRLSVMEGDVVYSREGGRFGIAATVPAGVELCLGQRMMQFRCHPGVNPDYFSLFLNSPLGFGQASADVGGSASPHVNIKAIRRFVLPLPPSAEQRRIVDRVLMLEAECRRLQTAIARHEAIGNALARTLTASAL